MLTKVVNVRLISGGQICDFWELDMVVISTTNGQFIDFGKNISDWRKSVGQAVKLKVEPCMRVPTLTWAYLS